MAYGLSILVSPFHLSRHAPVVVMPSFSIMCHLVNLSTGGLRNMSSQICFLTVGSFVLSINLNHSSNQPLNGSSYSCTTYSTLR